MSCHGYIDTVGPNCIYIVHHMLMILDFTGQLTRITVVNKRSRDSIDRSSLHKLYE
jgi:hypothetical protein